MNQSQPPDHARTVVVPVANPDTAPEMLTLARAVVRGDRARVIALVVVLGDADAEVNLDRIDALTQIVEAVRTRDSDVPMEVMTRPAVSVARGILDTIRDEGADLVVLGVQAPTPGGVAIGGVTEQVMRTADCDVLVYRRGRTGKGLEAIDGIVVGVDHSDQARVAARVGTILGEGLGHQVEMVHVRLPAETEAQAAHALDEALAGLSGEEHALRRVVPGNTPTQGLRSHVKPSKLTVVGFEGDASMGIGVLGPTSQGVLDSLRGPVVAVSRPVRLTGAEEVWRVVRQRLRPRLTDAEEQSLIWHARVNATMSTDFIVLCVVSAMLATFGLLLNSAAVIIGAMLVAPLMSPIVAVGTALVDGEVRTLQRATVSVAVGTAVVTATAFLIGLVFGNDTATPEMLSRGSPSLIDAGVAAASGVIGGYASARKGIPAALAGVAIAAALVPPICVFGLALTLDGRLAAGSGLLFITNIACIAAASAVVLLWLGVHLTRTGQNRKRYVRFTLPVVVAVLVALFLFGLSGRGPDLNRVQQIVESGMPGLEVVTVDTAGPPGTVTVTVRGTSPPPPESFEAAAAEVALATNGLILRVAHQPLVLTGS